MSADNFIPVLVSLDENKNGEKIKCYRVQETGLSGFPNWNNIGYNGEDLEHLYNIFKNSKVFYTIDEAVGEVMRIARSCDILEYPPESFSPEGIDLFDITKMNIDFKKLIEQKTREIEWQHRATRREKSFN